MTASVIIITIAFQRKFFFLLKIDFWKEIIDWKHDRKMEQKTHIKIPLVSLYNNP